MSESTNKVFDCIMNDYLPGNSDSDRKKMANNRSILEVSPENPQREVFIKEINAGCH